MKIFKTITSFFKPISPEDFLVKEIQPSSLTEVLIEERNEFFGKSTDGRSKEEMEKLLSEEPWKAFLSKLTKEDTLWFYKFPDKYWQKLMGRQGYIITKNGKAVAHITTYGN